MTSILQDMGTSDHGLLLHRLSAGQQQSGVVERTETGKKGDRAHLEAVCAEMESLFVNQLMTEMRKTVQKSGLIEGGMAEEIYTSMLDSELSREVAAAGGIGLAQQLMRDFGLGTGNEQENSNNS